MDGRTDTVAHPGWVWAIWWVVFPLAGVGLLWLLKLGAGWVASLPAAPLQGWFGLASAVPEPWASIAAVVVGLGAGAALALHAQHDSLAVTVSGQRVRLARGDRVTDLAREQVEAVFLDGKQLVVLGPAGRELARETSDLDTDRLARVFTAHRFRWCPDGDPYRDEFRRWAPDLPDLPAGADALFQARQKALSDDDGDDAEQLREELGRLGVVVRDDGTRQFWRRLPD